MRLSNLIASNKGLILHGSDTDVTGLTEDSRKVQPGFLFIAIPGNEKDGTHFINDALQRGAKAILVPTSAPVPSTSVPVLQADNIRLATASLAAAFYPQQPNTIVAITGTSGKTSTAQFTREIWDRLDHASASIGTLGYITSQESHYGSLTTPDPIQLHRLLHESAHNGITHVVMEASSHGLALARLDYVHLKAAGFTNFSRDHLDYHQTMETYLAAKIRLFHDLLPTGSFAILNADIPEYTRLVAIAKERGLKIISYGIKGDDLRLQSLVPLAQGQLLKLEVFGKKHEVLLPILGNFQAWNSLCALGLVIGCGENIDKALGTLPHLTGVPGRLQRVGATSSGGLVFIDYAHKPDALENVLKAMRPHVDAHPSAKLGVIFGCGGNRDKGKRPIMGALAQRLADWVIVTDDNPRYEDPALIRQDILAGCASLLSVQEIASRYDAIREGIGRLKNNDVLVIAGKGHESGQIIGDQVLPFNDAEEARKVLSL